MYKVYSDKAAYRICQKELPNARHLVLFRFGYAVSNVEYKVTTQGFQRLDVLVDSKDKDSYGNVVSNSDVSITLKPMPFAISVKATGQSREGTWTGMSGEFDTEIKVAVSPDAKQGMRLSVKANGKKASHTKSSNISIGQEMTNNVTQSNHTSYWSVL